MRIVIIEDEKITADDLASTILSVEPDAKIVAILSSVKTAISFFQDNEAPDLIFSDVQLGDGLSFEIFKNVRISAPIIFCTAYDEYALNAFKTNGIDYILKPSTSQTIADALSKYRNLCQSFSGGDQQYKALFEALTERNAPASTSLLVHYKDKIKPVKYDDIALFYIENEITYLLTFAKETYPISKTLDLLEQIAGRNFFRVSRQCLIHRKAVIDAAYYFSRKLSVNVSIPFHDKITVSKEKTPQFLTWLESVNP